MTSASGQTSADRRHLAPIQGRRGALESRLLRRRYATAAIKLVIGRGCRPATRRILPRCRDVPLTFRGNFIPTVAAESGGTTSVLLPASPSYSRSFSCRSRAYISSCFVCRRPVGRYWPAPIRTAGAEESASGWRTRANLDLRSSDATCRRCY